MEGSGLQESGWAIVWRTLQFAMQWLQSVRRVVGVILLVDQLGTSELRDSGGICSDVSGICFTIHFMP